MATDKTYIARSDAEAAALRAGTQTVIVILCKPQPHGAARFSGCDEPEPYISDARGKYRYYDPSEFCPYSPGDRIAVKESVATDGPWNIPSVCRYWYPADGGEQPRSYQLRSAANAPIESVRTHLVCRSVACKVQDGIWNWFVEVERETAT